MEDIRSAAHCSKCCARQDACTVTRCSACSTLCDRALGLLEVGNPSDSPSHLSIQVAEQASASEVF